MAGKIACFTGKVCIHGTTVEDTKVNILKIRNTDREFIHGQRAKNTMVAGIKTNNMAKQPSQIARANQREVSGNTEKERTGSNEKHLKNNFTFIIQIYNNNIINFNFK